MLPEIEVQSTKTTRWAVDLTSDDIEQIIEEWFRAKARVADTIHVETSWRSGQLPSLYVTAQLTTDEAS